MGVLGEWLGGTLEKVWPSKPWSAKISSTKEAINETGDVPADDASGPDFRRQHRGLHPGGEPYPDAHRREGARARAEAARAQRSRSGARAGAVAPAPRRVGRARLPWLRPGARRPDPGRQHRTDEGREALRPGAQR